MDAEDIKEHIKEDEAAEEQRLFVKKKKPVIERTSLKDALVMLIPFAGMALSLGEFLALPNVHPMGYNPHTWPYVIAVCAITYAIVYVVSCFVRPVRAKVAHYSGIITAFFVWFTIQDLLTLKSGILRMPFIPSPDKIMLEFVQDFDQIVGDAGASLRTLLTGLCIGIPVGIFSGILCGCVRLVDYWINPLLKIVGPVPALIWMPIFFVMFHSSTAAALSAVFIASWFPLTLMISSAIKNIDPQLIERAETLGASRLHIIFHVMLPNSIPAIANALFMAFSHSFGALSATELCGATAGLMFRINYTRGLANYGEVFACIGVMILIFSSLTAIMFAFRNWLLRWEKGLARW